MDAGNWVPVDKNLRHFFPHDRAYSVTEAYVCHRIDIDEGRDFSIAGYSALWRWDRKTVRNFLDVLGQRKDSFGTGKGTGKGHQLLLKIGQLHDEKDTIGTPERTEKGQRKDTTVILKTKPTTKSAKPEKPKRVLPEFLSEQVWESYRDHRRMIKRPMTDLSESMAIKKLEGMHREGHDVVAVVEMAIANGWVGIYEPKTKPMATNTGVSGRAVRRATDGM